MILNLTPTRQSNGQPWSPAQLQAIEALAEIRAAWQIITDAVSITGDTTPAAAEIKADLKALAAQAWAQVKAYPGP